MSQLQRSKRSVREQSTRRRKARQARHTNQRRLLMEQLEDRRLLAGTATKIDVNLSGASNPSDFVLFNNALYFAADDAAYGRELFKLDTSGAVTRVTDINASGASFALGQAYPAVYNGELYFRAQNGSSSGAELWKLTTGDVASLAAEINPSGSSNPAYLTVFDGELYFQADNGSSGAELFKYNGSSASLADMLTSGSSSPDYLTVFDSALYFAVTADDFHGQPYLWKMDTAYEFTPVGMLAGDASPWLTVNGSLYYFGGTSIAGYNLYECNTSGSLTTVAGVGSGSSAPSHMMVFGGNLYFQAADEANGAELWKSDGTGLGTALLQSINSGTASSSPQYLAEFNGELYFQADGGANGAELWKYNSSTNTATQAADISAGAGTSGPMFLIAFNDALYFSADAGSDRELYKYADMDDFGDAPNPYPTTQAQGGAQHTAAGPTLGINRDVEPDGQPSVGAVDDDNNGTPDDEDGVTISNSFTIAPSGTARATVSAPAGGVLDAWLDFNGDGDWGDTGEQIATNVSMSSTLPNFVDFAVPAGATVGTTYARFRIASAAGDVTAPTGTATNGEVEDYQVAISVPTTIYVDDDWATGGSDPKAPGDPAGSGVFGYNAFATIQAGINAVASTGTVNVAAGTYAAAVSIGKQLQLIGDLATPPTIAGQVDVANADHVVIQSFNVSGNYVYLSNANNADIDDLAVSGGEKGLWVTDSTGGTFDGVNLSGITRAAGSPTALLVRNGGSHRFTDLTISDVTTTGGFSWGVNLGSTSNNVFQNTSIRNVQAGSSSSYGIYMVGANGNQFTDTVIDTISGLPGTVGNQAWGVLLQVCSNNTFTNYTATNLTRLSHHI